MNIHTNYIKEYSFFSRQLQKQRQIFMCWRSLFQRGNYKEKHYYEKFKTLCKYCFFRKKDFINKNQSELALQKIYFT